MKKFARFFTSVLLSGCLLAGTVGSAAVSAAVDELPAWPKDRPLKILAIGNSFSEDAMRWMYDIAGQCGAEDVTFANLYIGGCELARHWDNAKNDNKAYDYQKISKETGGSWTHSGENAGNGGNPWSISQGLADEEWDYITIQQVSGYSGVPSTYASGDTNYVDELVGYIRERSRAKIGWHMTWAYQQDSGHGDFGRYDKDQMTMYNAITSTVQDTVLANRYIKYVVPAGTAIQNMRSSYVGDTLTRDGYHMSYNLGRYIVGLTWISKITGWSIDELTWTPSAAEVPQAYLPIIKEAVKNAVEHPYEVTPSSYQSGPFYNDYEDKELLDLKTGATKYGFWQSDNSASFNKPVTNAGNSNQFVATRTFTKADIPVGSIIELDPGYQYRPDGWVNFNEVNKQRPNSVSSQRVTVDESWWGSFTVRGFNVSKQGNPALDEAEAEDILNHIRIYAPTVDLNDYTELDLKTGATERAYWNTGDTVNHSQLITGADNSKYFVATRRITEAEMPVGSVITLNGGWQFRPERWIQFGEKQENRPDNVKTAWTEVDESWWDGYTERAFNISLIANQDMTGRLDEAFENFHVYVPKGKSSKKSISSIAFETLPTESCVFGQDSVTVTLSKFADVTAVAPTLTVSSKAVVSPASGVPQDFSKPVTYTVTAEDGSTRDYAVSIVLPEGGAAFLEARAQAVECLRGLEVSNETTGEDILEALEKAIGNKDIALAWHTPFTKIEATASAAGSITGEISLARGEFVLYISAQKEIEKLADPILKGDVNQDGGITITDVMGACKILARKSAGQEPSPEEILYGDVNGDGYVTITDVMAICKLLAQKA